MAMNGIPTDEQVWKQVRKCLSLDDDDEMTPVPPFLFQPIKNFMISNPGDNEFVIECSVPGRSHQPYGEVTCLEESCFKDVLLEHDDQKIDGGVGIGLGSFDAFRREARKAKEATNALAPSISSRGRQQSSAMLARLGSGSFGALNERKPEIQPKRTAVQVKPEVEYVTSKSKIGAGPGGSKRPIFVLSDSEDDDELHFKAKRSKASSTTTPPGKRAVVFPAPPFVPLKASSSVKSQPSTSQAQRTLDRYLKPGAHHLPPNSNIPDVKPAASALSQVASSSAVPVVPSALAASAPVTHEELDAEEQIAMCRKALSLPTVLPFPSKVTQVWQYLNYVCTCRAAKQPITIKASAYLPELSQYVDQLRQGVRNAFRQQGRGLPEEPLGAPSAMSRLSNALAPQNAASGMLGENAEEAAENRRLSMQNADDLQSYFKDSLDDFAENVTVSDAATKLGLAHMNDLLPGMSVSLMPHQIIGVQWMVDKEKGKNHGGILADAMGLGKTIQTIATMIANPSTDPTCKTTLIVAPLALLEQWKLEIESKTYGQLDVYVFHGPNKNITKKKLKKYDVVLTTYGTLVQQFPAPEKRKKKKKKRDDYIDDSGEEDSEFESSTQRMGPLAELHFYRVVLDEAAQIRNRHTRGAKACFQLEAVNRWVLSGTLTACTRIQAILKFGCLRRTKDTLIDGKPLLQLPEKKVAIAEEDFDEDERALYTASTVLKNMRNVLIMILRLRQVCAHASLIVRKPGEAGHHDDLLLEADDERLNNNKAVQEESHVDSDREVEVGRARVFGGDALVERLKAKLALRQTEDDAQPDDGDDGDFQCIICFEPFLGNERITSCLHSYCVTCIADITKKQQEDVDFGMAAPGTKALCPMCRGSMNADNIFTAAAFEPEVVVTSEDIKADQDLLDELDLGPPEKSIILPSAKMRKTSELVTGWLAANEEDKIVIFSQFVTFIGLVEDHLADQGIECFTYTGSMSKVDRDATIANFTNPRNPVRVILISTKAGGVGLNLTIANKAICLDLAWNSATEQQAIDRIHRIGQTKPVEVHRIVIPNSIEQRILALQEKFVSKQSTRFMHKVLTTLPNRKAALAEGAYGEGKGGKLGRLSLQDLMALFDARRDRADEEL
ncbi:hypothetical protein QFC21_005835 [Naganishia friedmannii]|uniref:Uncharacterized protein n=1 Tax=Naganishia friedmannii TaxID=89922 RepID=A0ACC2V6C8_9TREE|nr:hypothetical protein QFC21_005835 [Naganishia friedmannii]